MANKSLAKEKRIYNIAYLIKLLSAAISGTRPPEPDENIDFDFIYKFAEMHSVTNTAFYAVEKLKNKPNSELYKKWMDERNKCIHRNMIQTIEYGNITSTFKAQEIEFLPVKGFPICDLYPQPDYRYMNDIDILIKKDLNKADALIKNLGYMPKMVGKVHHDEFQKPPFMIVELHHEIVGTDSVYYDYYSNVFDRCIKKDNFEYEMTGEDFYIFVLVHLNKHFKGSGTGIKSIMDIYMLNQKSIPNLNMDYIEKELKKLNLWDFNNLVVSIADKWFKKQDTEHFSNDEMYILTSGTYGTEKHKVLNRKGDKKGVSFLMYRFFPPMSWMKSHFHILRKYPFLLPAVYIYRIFTGIFFKGDKIKSEIEILNEHKN